MPKVTFQWQGVAEFKKTLEAVGAALDDRDPKVKAVILGPSMVTVERSKNLIHNVTGTLASAVYATVGGKTQRGVLLGVRKKKAPYAGYVEFGTSKMTARPYFRPALLQMAGTFVDDIAPYIKQIVEETAADNAWHETS
jgi:HK97 gp10 family phage protein